MRRRDIIRSLFIGAASTKSFLNVKSEMNHAIDELDTDAATRFKSKRHLYPDMPWTGEDLWTQRLQDWCIKDGELRCLVHAPDRSVHILTHQLSEKTNSFKAAMSLRFLHQSYTVVPEENYIGFRIGAQGRHKDYRSAIMTGTGVDIGISRNGYLFIGKSVGGKKIDESKMTGTINLSMAVTPHASGQYTVKLKATDRIHHTLATWSAPLVDVGTSQGNIAIISHQKAIPEYAAQPSVAISNLVVKGEKLNYFPQQVFGAVYFAQYTLHAGILKLTAQLSPIDIPGTQVNLFIQKDHTWEQIAKSQIHPLARIANFRIVGWDSTKAVKYKISCSLPLKNGQHKEYSYEGTIAAEPIHKSNIRALAFSCNWDYGFPDNEVVDVASAQNADMVFFLGDQFYEANGGFGTQMNPLDKACLDYLRKWIMFGWSYRALFRNIPMVALPDDHDMYHGNIWGAGGRATRPLFDGSDAQDTGGYKMLPEWINMAQLTQTSHMPDAFDPTPILQGIQVYYTEWDYAGISFGIIEDRKFKSPPKDILPEEAKVWNGYAANPDFDLSKIKDLQSQLLGERQLFFLDHWSKNNRTEYPIKVMLSATPFCCLQTLPLGALNDQITPDLPIPQKGEYVKGDAPTRDMDSNGWPHHRRNEALKLLGKNIDLHIVGDQHLPSIVQYGVEEYNDSVFCFAVPALCNIWPRRWWPPVDEQHQSLPGKPSYTGNFEDGFGNKITVHAVANPYETNKEPAVFYNRTTGFGLVEFDTISRDITLHCWPRFKGAVQKETDEFEGWPITINKSAVKH